MISYSEAIELINSAFKNVDLQTETVSIEHCTNRTLAEDIYSDVDLPPFDNSAVDGYAILFNEDIRAWNLIGEISAGNYVEYDLDEHSTVSIMTGSKIPDKCNAIIPIEDVEVEGDRVTLKEESFHRLGMNIRKKGSDIKEGELAIEKGTLLKARHIAALATCGKAKVKVYKQMVVSVLSTGDELIPVDEIPTGDKLRVSNNYAICSMINELYQVSKNLEFINDNRDEIKNKIESELNSDTDIIITTGGISVGKHDFLKSIFEELGVKQVFWRAYIKPGKPAYFGTYEKNGKYKLVYGLPGNPVSSLVNFEVYIKPFIKKLFGLGETEYITATLEHDLRKKDKKRHFMKAFYYVENGINMVRTQKSQSSGSLVELSQSNCLIEVPENVLNPQKGEQVKCLKI